MQEHELRVKCLATDKEITVSQKFYAANPQGFEVLEGEPAKVVESAFEPPKMPVTNVVEPTKPKANKAEKEPVKQTKPKVAPPVVK